MEPNCFMSTPPDRSPATNSVPASPATWNADQLVQNWVEHLSLLAQESACQVPLNRLKLQVEQDTIYQETLQRWPRMDNAERLAAWKRLLECSIKHSQEVLPICVRCGDCCRKSSPTLHLEDLDLLLGSKIPWNQLLTLRSGEPVHSPFEEELFFLLDERIKVREKVGIQECVFFDADANECLIYENRPMQCRAQACWDDEPARQLTEQPYLTRRDIFKDVELLQDLIGEHDRRCSFGRLQNAFKQLEENQAQGIDAILELLAYEEHFRQFLAEKLNIPADTLPLIFGRSYEELAPLFGFCVKVEADGSKCLMADPSTSTKEDL
jgi:Fe-S-cluster containining protein